MNSQTGRSIPIILAVLLGGCSMMPNDGQPGASASAAKRDSMQLKLTTGLELDGWQYYFPDARLQELIATALENNRDLNKAAPRLAQVYARYGFQQTDRRAGQNPAAPENNSRAQASGVPAGSGPAALQDNPEVSLLPYEADFWKHIRSLNMSATAGFLEIGSAQHAFRLSLISAVANTYWSLLEMRERVRLAGATVKACAETRELIGHRHDAGVSSDADLLQAQNAYQAAVADLENLKRLQAGEGNLLTALIAEPAAEIWGLPEAAGLAEQDIGSGLLAGLPADVLLRRPDILAAEQQLHAADVDISAARADFLPRITLTGENGKASSHLNGLFDPASGAWNYQPAAGARRFDAGPSSASLDTAGTRRAAAVAEYQRTIQQAFRDVADLLAERNRLAKQLAVQQVNTETQIDALHLVEVRYKIGVVSHLEVLDAQRQVFAAEQSETRARGAWLITATQLYKALGGEGNDAAGNAAREKAGTGHVAWMAGSAAQAGRNIAAAIF